MNNINEFIDKSFAYIRNSFNRKTGNKFDFLDVYPYIMIDYEKYEGFDICDNSTYDYIGKLYEAMLPLDVKKDYGQFYTRNSDVIDLMLDGVDLLRGKILEPSCGSGMFVISVIEKIIPSLQKKNFDSEKILNYICDNIHANDNDVNAIKITELNVLSYLMPLILDAKKSNSNFVMKKLSFTNFDFTYKRKMDNSFSVIIGNPPFVTMYGKRSRNMTEEKRTYYNTFNFVQNKKGNNKFNTSMFFVENGLEALESSGVLSYILDISFFETAFKDLRKYIVQNYYIDSMITKLNEFSNVASGQLVITIQKRKEKNDKISLIDYVTKSVCPVDQAIWDSDDTEYKFFNPLLPIEKEIKRKMEKFNSLGNIFPGKSLRTCCALTGRTEDFLVQNNDESTNCTIFPFIEGAKGISGKFCKPQVQRYIKYDYDLQIEISNEFKKELESKGVKNKKRVTLGDKEAYLSNKIFIRQSATEIVATFCSEPYAANNSIYILTTKNNDKKSIELLKYTCGILNSDLISFYSRICHIIRMGKGKTPQIKISDLKKIRLAINESQFNTVILMVDSLLNNQKDEVVYKKLNQIVYDIYGISSEEIDYIENYLKISKGN